MIQRQRTCVVIGLILLTPLLVAACGRPDDANQAADRYAFDQQTTHVDVLPLPPDPTATPQPPPTPTLPSSPAEIALLLAQLGYPLPTRAPAGSSAAAASGASGSAPRSAPEEVEADRSSRTDEEERDEENRKDEEKEKRESSEDSPAQQPDAPADTPVPPPPAPTNPPAPTEDTSLLEALRRGGHVIYLRHTGTDWSQSDREEEWVKEVMADPGLFKRCDRQRLLTDAGRDEARRIGESVRRLGIPVGRVLSSAWCRTRETAELAFGGANVARDKIWDTGYLDSDSSERKHYRDALRKLLSESPGGGSNTVIVGHMPQLLDAAGVALEEGEAAVVRPEGGGFMVLERVRADGWDRLGGG